MTCERYWRDGIVLVERGLDDPHRDGCEDCRRAHVSRQELIEALPLIGAGLTGDPDWQAKVWQRIDGEHAPAPSRWRWQLAGALAAACAVVLWIGVGRGRVPPSDVRPRTEVIPGDVAMRSGSNAVVGDRLRVTVGEVHDVWIYRGDQLVLQCRARRPSAACKPDAHGMIVEMVLSTPVTYHVFSIEAPPATLPGGKLDEDRAALESASIHYRYENVPVR